MHTWLHDIMQTSSQAQIDNVEQLRLLKVEIVESAEMHRRAIVSNKVADLSANSEAILQSVLVALQNIGDRGDDSTRCQRIISSLTFKEMPMRHLQIPETYANTFAWILDDYPFRPWLESSDGTFWIDGKPGSGKSTMMKMLSQALRTREILNTWSGMNKLVMSSVFFWSSGFPMQRSQLGFLQSLVYQVLRHFPEQVPTLCQRRWQASSRSEEFDPWTKSELLEILASITTNTSLNARHCFFIDGLDECDGEHYELVQILEDLSQSKAVKICVSSRPWNVFRKAFGGSPELRLILQNLTTNDMDRYIRDKLEADPQFRLLAAADSSAHLFPQEIRNRAKGVFLWVFLVVRSLLRGLTEDDDMAMLRERFRDIPDDLETYFKRMIGAVDKVYDRYMARSLLLACTAEGPLPLSSYSYIDVDQRNHEFAMQAAHEPYTRESFFLMKRNVENRISKWCRDLLEISVGQRTSANTPDPIFQFQVDFLHRTVRDFLVTGTMRGYLEERTGSNFRPEATLSRIFLVHAKTVPLPFRNDDRKSVGQFQYAAGNMMYYTRKHELKYEEGMLDLIHELDRIGKVIYPPSQRATWVGERIPKDCIVGSQASSSWSPIWDEGKQLAPGDLISSRLHRKRDLIAYAVEFDLQLFVQETLHNDRRRINEPGATPLLYHALGAVIPSELGLPNNNTPHAMVTLLLNMEADINIPMSTWPGATLWRILLHSISAAKSSSTSLGKSMYSSPNAPKMVTRPKEYIQFDSPALALAWMKSKTNDALDVDSLETQCGPTPKHDPAIRWHFSALEDICRSLCSDTEAKLSRGQAPLPVDDASLLELMLHHGADPEAMDTRVLCTLLEQCCGDCQIRFKKYRAKDDGFLVFGR
jgi:hypothetical protein